MRSVEVTALRSTLFDSEANEKGSVDDTPDTGEADLDEATRNEIDKSWSVIPDD